VKFTKEKEGNDLRWGVMLSYFWSNGNITSHRGEVKKHNLHVTTLIISTKSYESQTKTPRGPIPSLLHLAVTLEAKGDDDITVWSSPSHQNKTLENIPVCLEQLLFSPLKKFYATSQTSVSDEFSANPGHSIYLWSWYLLHNNISQISIYLDFINKTVEDQIRFELREFIAKRQVILIHAYVLNRMPFESQRALIAHSVARNKQSTEWLLLNDVDEYFFPGTKYQTLTELLNEYDSDPEIHALRAKSRLYFNLNFTANLDVWTHNYATEPEDNSHKLIVRPGRVNNVGIHRISKANEQRMTLNIDPDLLYVAHFRNWGAGNKYIMKRKLGKEEPRFLAFWKSLKDRPV